MEIFILTIVKKTHKKTVNPEHTSDIPDEITDEI